MKIYVQWLQDSGSCIEQPTFLLFLFCLNKAIIEVASSHGGIFKKYDCATGLGFKKSGGYNRLSLGLSCTFCTSEIQRDAETKKGRGQKLLGEIPDLLF